MPITLATLLDPEAVAGWCPAGFDGDVGLFVEGADRLRALGHGPETEPRAFFVPGRLELVGKHTDYAGGRSLVAATEQGFHVVAAERDDGELRLHDLADGASARLDLTGELTATPGHWTTYPCAVARRLRRDFVLEPRGADIVFASDLPRAAGMASSSALVVATWLALAAINRVAETEVYGREIGSSERLAEYLAAVEAGRSHGALAADEGVGTQGGSQDHTAVLCARAGVVSQYSYMPARRVRTIELPSGWTFAVAVSGVRAEKAAGARDAYNHASVLAAELAALWRQETGEEDSHLGAILGRGASGRDTLARLALLAEENGDGVAEPGELTRRLEHFIAESEEIVPAAGQALSAGDLESFGRLVDYSQRLAEKLLGNQTPETAALAVAARELGATGASAFGAGFGGSVWALIEEERLDGFLETWRNRYLYEFPERAAVCRFFSSRPGPGAFVLGPLG